MENDTEEKRDGVGHKMCCLLEMERKAQVAVDVEKVRREANDLSLECDETGR